ncbi:MAG TPA: glutathione S-transferase family protein [Hyphomicrobiaceae bacterium]|nr:glutathione S-transferase family protein [Hyphomicrobiaceae bacterium]
MLKIYGLYRSRATRNIWLCDELGIPFELVPVIQADRPAGAATAKFPLTTKSPEFLKINPNGHIPSIDDDGLILHESLGINLYLAKKHGGPLAPANIAEDGLMTTWTAWAMTEVEPRSIQVLYHRVAKPADQRDPKIADANVAALKAPFAVLDKALAESGYIVGGRFTVADINVAECVRYAMAAPDLFETNPNVKAWLAKVQARPAFKAMMAKRDAEPA